MKTHITTITNASGKTGRYSLLHRDEDPDDLYTVVSLSSGNAYTTTPESCTCPDRAQKDIKADRYGLPVLLCKHSHAVALHYVQQLAAAPLLTPPFMR